MSATFVTCVFAVGLLFEGPHPGPTRIGPAPPGPKTDEEYLQRGGIATGDADLLRLIERHAVKEVDEKEVARLLRQLDAADFKDREKASEALLALGPSARKALDAASKSENPEVARRVANCLDQLRREAPYVDGAVRVFMGRRQLDGLRALWRVKDPSIRNKALVALDEGKADPAQLVPLLLEGLDDPDEAVGTHSQNAIWVTIQPQQFPLVLAAAKDKRPRMRSRAFFLFGKFRTEGKTLAPLLLDALTDENVFVRRSAARALSFFGSEKEVLPALLKAMEDPDNPANPDEGSVAQWATSSLGACLEQNPTLVISTLTRVARTGKNESVRTTAATSIGWIGAGRDAYTKEALQILVGFLKDKEDFRLRGMGTLALYRMGAKAEPAMPALLQALDTKDVADPAVAKTMRLKVMSVFYTIGPGAKDAVPVLIEIAQSPKYDLEERRSAISALGRIGLAAKDAIPVLTNITAEKNAFELWQTARWALQQIKR
jgi:HEAT repeat protein